MNKQQRLSPRLSLIPVIAMLAWTATTGVRAQTGFTGTPVTGVRVVIDPVPQDPKLGTKVKSAMDDRFIHQIATMPSLPKRPGDISTPPTHYRPVQVLYADPLLFSSERMCAPLHVPAIRTQVNEQLKNVIKAQVMRALPRHFGVHSSSNHQLGAGCDAAATVMSNWVSLTLLVPHNRMFIRITTPDGVPGALDPDFVVFYDLRITATIHLPTSLHDKVALGPLNFAAINISKPESRSITGQLATAINDFMHFLGGPDFVARLRENRYVTVNPPLAIDLSEWNRRLAAAHLPADMRIENIPEGDQLVSHLTTRKPPNVH
ncbi:hypothetical protein [Dyella ginsengisoli]|uniref:hypothetical protein n=1 Tax=Dyella ginsengisoli TaxID=363848 RepID=UPI0003664547|nr:hypothetical protein [Dyella ginsengisoli]